MWWQIRHSGYRILLELWGMELCFWSENRRIQIYWWMNEEWRIDWRFEGCLYANQNCSVGNLKWNCTHNCINLTYDFPCWTELLQRHPLQNTQLSCRPIRTALICILEFSKPSLSFNLLSNQSFSLLFNLIFNSSFNKHFNWSSIKCVNNK